MRFISISPGKIGLLRKISRLFLTCKRQKIARELDLDLTKPWLRFNSEYHLVDERIVGLKPKSMDFAQATEIPLIGLTSYEAIFNRLKVSKNVVTKVFEAPFFLISVDKTPSLRPK